jgi:hypothetical protein
MRLFGSEIVLCVVIRTLRRRSRIMMKDAGIRLCQRG